MKWKVFIRELIWWQIAFQHDETISLIAKKARPLLWGRRNGSWVRCSVLACMFRTHCIRASVLIWLCQLASKCHMSNFEEAILNDIFVQLLRASLQLNFAKLMSLYRCYATLLFIRKFLTRNFYFLTCPRQSFVCYTFIIANLVILNRQYITVFLYSLFYFKLCVFCMYFNNVMSNKLIWIQLKLVLHYFFVRRKMYVLNVIDAQFYNETIRKDRCWTKIQSGPLRTSSNDTLCIMQVANLFS